MKQETSIAQCFSIPSGERCKHRENQQQHLIALFSVYKQASLPNDWQSCRHPLPTHAVNNLIGIRHMHDVTSATAKILQLEQKRLPYGTRPFLLLRRVWLARLVIPR